MEKFDIKCASCGDNVQFATSDISELEERIAVIRSESYDSGYANGEGFGNEQGRSQTAYAVTGGERPMWELAAAIRRGDRAEAELQLDRVAEQMGDRAIEDVQQGRYSPQAKAVV